MHIVEARGFSGRIWLFWDDETKFSVLTTGDQFIHGVIDVGTGNEIFCYIGVWSSEHDFEEIFMV